MSKIIGVTVGTPLSADKIKEKIKPVLSVDGVKADAKGDVKVQRTHWKEVDPMVSLFNRSDVGYEYTQADRIGLEVGEAYEVYYNGNTYDTVGTAYSADGETGVTLKKADGTIPGCTIIDFSSKTAERIGYGFRISKPVSQYQTVTIIGPRITWHKLERGYLPDEAIQEAVEAGLEEAKASGKFDGPAGAQGEQGKRGPGVLKITTAPTSYTTAIGDYTPKYRILLSTVKTQSGVGEVLVGDTLLYTYYNYKIDYISGSYAYISETRNTIRGATGEAGTKGNDGYSPTVAVADITGGHRVTITDVNGTQTFDVMDGKDGAGGSGGGVTDYNKLENRPFGSNGVQLVELLPETTVEINPDAGNAELSATVPLVEGQTYTVKYNGVDYECVCSTMTDGVTYYILGNIGAMMGGDGTGEPFIFMSIPDMGACGIFALDGSASVTLSISGGYEDIDKMEGKFLPKGTPYIEPFDDVILEETVLAGALVTEMASGNLYNLPIGNIKPGNIYNIVIDGHTYQAKAYPPKGDNAALSVAVLGTGYYGNGAVNIPGIPYSNLPFQMTVFGPAVAAEYGANVQINWTTEETPEKLAIKGGFTVNKMDELCLPDFPIPKIVTFTPFDDGSNKYEADTEYFAALSAVDMGRPLFAKVWNSKNQDQTSGFALCMCQGHAAEGITFGYFKNGYEVAIRWNNQDIVQTKTMYTKST